MIYDCFILFNELDLLEIRLHELSPVVDKFVLVEATRTFSGLPKLLYYAENQKRFARFNNRIIYVVVDDMSDSGDAWAREHHQRNAILRGLKDCAPDDVILISDVDEIPRAEKLADIQRGINVFSQTFYYYYLNVICENKPALLTTRAVRRSELTSPQKIREASGHIIYNGGWHFSYLGGTQAIENKIRSFSHQEYNNALYRDTAYIEKCIKEGRDFLGRDYRWKTVQIDDTFPKYIQQNLSKFSKYIKKTEDKIDSYQSGLSVSQDKYFDVIYVAQKQINQLKIVIDKRDIQIFDLGQAMAERDARIVELNHAVVKRDARIVELNNELLRIYTSKKWKLIMKVATPVLLAKPGISKIKGRMKGQLVTVPLKHCAKLVRRFFEITADLGLRVAITEVFFTLAGKDSVLIKPLSVFRDLSKDDAFSIPGHVEFVEIFRALFKRLKLAVDAEKAWKLISSHLDFAALHKLQMELFILHRFFLAADAKSPCKLIQALTLPQSRQVPRKRNILFITSLFPNPIHGGGGRVMDFIKVLAENNTVYLYSFYNPFEDRHAYQQALRYCAGIRRVFFWNPAKNLGYIRDWLKDISIDIVHYEWPESLTNHDPFLSKSHIFTYMESVSLRLLMDMSRESPLSLPWIEKLENLIHYLKIELVDASDMNVRVAVTTKDAEFFRSLVPGLEYIVLNHGISVSEFCLPDVEPKPYTLTFVGNFLHPPNEEALRFFFGSVWDDVLRELPKVKIYIVGAYPSKGIRELSKKRNVFVTGKVLDVRPYIQKASVCIAPLVSGAGLRGKVLQYASLRRTFVATPIAVTDLILTDGSDYLQATNAKEFSEKVVELLKDGKRARQMGSKAFETVMEHYDNHRLVGYLTRIYDWLDERIYAQNT